MGSNLERGLSHEFDRLRRPQAPQVPAHDGLQHLSLRASSRAPMSRRDWPSRRGSLSVSSAGKSLAQYLDYKEWFFAVSSGAWISQRFFGFPILSGNTTRSSCRDSTQAPWRTWGGDHSSLDLPHHAHDGPAQGPCRTILHEMAHMWFGDLVTMRWWNGLWLNECSRPVRRLPRPTDQATRFESGGRTSTPA